MALALTVGVLIGGGVFMMLRRGMIRLIIGFILLSHGVNLLIMAAGGADRRGEPLGTAPDPAITADPLPQAFVLTAIVIAFSITMYMLVLAVTGDDDDDTDLELTGREMETPDLMDDDADDTGTNGDAPEDPDPVGTSPEREPGRGGRA
jgi:multicomponent Na+:H+ antiporter subunit C